MTDRNRTALRSLALATCLSLATLPGSLAWSAAADNDVLEEVVVTASRFSENLQRTPLAIESFSADALQAQGVTQATDLNKLALGLQVGLGGSTSQIYVRGIGDASANPLANPGVAFNIDGVYVGRPEGVGQNFYDVQRLEVLKGPQGTLYGRNTSGGAINLLTNSPKLGTFEQTLNVDVGNYSLFHVDGALNLPLSDVVALRVAVNTIRRDGYLTDGTMGADERSARAKLLVQPSDAFSLLFSVDGTQVRGQESGYVYLPRRPGSDPWEGSTTPAANAWVATFNPATIPGQDDSFTHHNFWNASGELNSKLNFADLTVIAAYRHTDTDTLSYNAQSQHLLDTSSQSTLEARLSHASDRYRWVAGLYYFKESNPGNIQIFVGPGLLKSNPTYDPEGKSYAAFGEATFNATDSFRLITGARYTSENRTLSGHFYVYPTQGTNFIDVETFGGDVTFRKFTWKLGAELDVSPQSMMFVTASTGFKAGGITQTVPPNNVYQPETVLAFELGSKNRLLDDKLQLNVEAFHWTYKDQQNSHLTFDTLGNVNFLTQNAGAAKIYGVNVDLRARMTSHDTVHAAAEYDHSKYGTFLYQVPVFAYSPATIGCANPAVVAGPFVPLAVVDCSGFQLPHAPTWVAQADYTHSFPLAAGGSVDFNASARYSASEWLSVDFIPSERAPSFTKWDSSLTYRAASNHYTVSAYVRNITNAVEYTSGQEASFTAGLNTAIISPPRTFGVQLHISY